MDNYFKYFPVSDEEKNWGLFVLNVGFTKVQPFVCYPVKMHPYHHYFSWENGRTLQEYQIIYIANGEGFFESSSCKKQRVEKGTVIMLFPGEWHRYKPNEQTGWDEYWVGLSGPIIDNLLIRQYFKPEAPLQKVGYDEGLISLFTGIIDLSKHEKPGFQYIISGSVMHLLGNLFAKSKESDFEPQYIDIISQAKTLFRLNIGNKFSPENVAEELQVGYSWFRKTFKAHTGMAPGQYFIDLKIQRAKQLLCEPNSSVKCIAYNLKFDSVFYFSKIFKGRTGLTPIEFKKQFCERKNQLGSDKHHSSLLL